MSSIVRRIVRRAGLFLLVAACMTELVAWSASRTDASVSVNPPRLETPQQQILIGQSKDEEPAGDPPLVNADALVDGGEIVAPRCLDGIKDVVNPSDCIKASRTPTAGLLFPLGEFFFVNASTGFAGFGTLNPQFRLDVNGPTRIQSGGSAALLFSPEQDHSGPYADIHMVDTANDKTLRIGGGDDVIPQRGAVVELEGVGAGGNLRLLAGSDGSISLENGFVGIGTQSPWAHLTLAASTEPTIGLWRTSTDQQYLIKIESDDTLRLARRGSVDFVLDPVGNVGIGTATPRAKLHVTDGTGNSILRVEGLQISESEINRYNPHADIYIQNRDASDNSVNDVGNTIINPHSGNVGIGRTSAQAKLDVEGEIRTRATGVRYPDNSLQASAASVTNFFNVKNFGARGDGQTNDTQSFQTAVQRLQDAGGGTLFVPAGLYRLTTQLEIRATVVLMGEHKQLSKLLWISSNGGVFFDAGSDAGPFRKTFRAHDLSFLTDTAGGGTALTLTSQVNPGNVGTTAEILDCDFAPLSTDRAYWNVGLELNDVREDKIEGCAFHGRRNANSYYAPGTIAVWIHGTHSATGYVFKGVSAGFWETAYYMESAGLGGPEGVGFKESGAFLCNKGILSDSVGPGFYVTNCHFTCFKENIHAISATDGEISNNLIYVPNPSQVESTGIVVEGTSFALNIANNTIRKFDGIDFNGIVINGDTRELRIESNRIINASTAIYLGPQTYDSFVLDNDYTGPGSHIINQGRNHVIREIE